MAIPSWGNNAAAVLSFPFCLESDRLLGVKQRPFISGRRSESIELRRGDRRVHATGELPPSELTP